MTPASVLRSVRRVRSGSGADRSEGDRVPRGRHRRDVMFEAAARRFGQQVRGPTLQPDFVAGGPLAGTLAPCRRRTDVWPELHPARREQRYAGDDPVLRSIAMPADW